MCTSSIRKKSPRPETFDSLVLPLGPRPVKSFHTVRSRAEAENAPFLSGAASPVTRGQSHYQSPWRPSKGLIDVSQSLVRSRLSQRRLFPVHSPPLPPTPRPPTGPAAQILMTTLTSDPSVGNYNICRHDKAGCRYGPGHSPSLPPCLFLPLDHVWDGVGGVMWEGGWVGGRGKGGGGGTL